MWLQMNPEPLNMKGSAPSTEEEFCTCMNDNPNEATVVWFFSFCVSEYTVNQNLWWLVCVSSTSYK